MMIVVIFCTGQATTKPRLQDILQREENLDIEGLIKDAIANLEMEVIV